MQQKMLVLNFKSYLGIRESVANSAWVGNAMANGAFKGYEMIIAPPTIAMAKVAEEIGKGGISLCAQDFDRYGKGAHTGSVSMEGVLEAGCKYSMLGHSELRHRGLESETEQMVADKLEICIGNGINPILCIGETFEERRDGKTIAVLERQIGPVIAAIDERYSGKICVAYEPVWAISSTMKQKPEAVDMAEAIDWIKEELDSTGTKADTVILYGGSVNYENINDYLNDQRIGGVIIGSASTRIPELEKISDSLKYKR